MFVRPMVKQLGQVREARAGDGVLSMLIPTTDTTDAAATITTAAILGGLWVHSGHTASRIDTTPTAALLLAAMPGMDIGDTFLFKVSSGAAFTIVVAGGVGVTASGNLTVLANGSKDFLLTKDSATTMTLLGL